MIYILIIIKNLKKHQLKNLYFQHIYTDDKNKDPNIYFIALLIISELLKHLPLYDFYNKLDTELKDAKILDSDCSVCNAYVPITPEGKKEQYNLCKKVCYILQFSENIQSISESINNDKLCLYVNLWLYHHATKIPDFPERIDNLYNALNLIKTKRDNKVNQCNLTDYSISNSEFKHKQILFEFFENYENLKKMLESQDDINVQLYCNHIKKHFLYYNNIKETCVPENSCKFHDELKNFKEKFSNPVDLKLIYEKCDYEKTLCEKGSNGENDVPCLKEKGYSFLYLIFGNDADNIINILLKVTTISAPILTLFVILFRVLNYDQYMYFKEKFDPKKTSLSESKSLNEIFKETDIPEVTQKDYSKAFDVLLKHIHNDGVFLGDHRSEACKYINYILYKTVERGMERNYDENIAKYFKKFLVAYGKLHPARNNRCILDIYNIEPKTFYEINALYDVYDKYKNISSFKQATVQHGCKFFEEFFRKYDNYMFGTQYKSLKFNEILQNIEQHALNSLSLYRNEKICKDYKNNLQSPRLYIPPPVKEPEIQKELQMGQAELQSVDSTSHHETYGMPHTLQPELTNDIPRSQRIQENQGTYEGHGANVIHSADDSYRGRSHLETIDTPIRADEKRTQMFSRFPEPLGHPYSSRTPLYSGQHGHVGEQATSNEAEGASSSVMNTITGVFQSVEPAPILGVSGGMGALFLLFKVFNILKLYTYVYNIFK
ncbi:hypothetical protein PVMG_06171 [Plasmodium vivax Mauritania I]|uniref:Uncharacterized protein n=1 Tax=Plasmodium vivax Mauritania I TaxID=1035515 RepID=A0A0J9TKX9_PLAVI|nr:hypothetical protein PVMG_06171 [Plasmodium vivax Mauritania I]